jgi:hypothetical protein
VRKALLVALAVVAAVLGWGWWQAQTHADVAVNIGDIALKTPQQRWAALQSGTVVLRDHRGQALAHSRVTAPNGSLEFSDAAAGDCGRFERQSPYDAAARGGWQACYEARSRWQAGWADKVAFASVGTGNCNISEVPVQARRYDNWWLWWVPLPHVGGAPTAYYAFNLYVDSAACAAVSPGP